MNLKAKKRKGKPVGKQISRLIARYWKKRFSMSARKRGVFPSFVPILWRLKYNDNQLCPLQFGNRHTVPGFVWVVALSQFCHGGQYCIPRFVRSRTILMLEILSEKVFRKYPKLTASAMFLPMIFPTSFMKNQSRLQKKPILKVSALGVLY